MFIKKQKETFFTVNLDKEDVKDIEDFIDTFLVSKDKISIVNKINVFENVMVDYVVNRVIERFDDAIDKKNITFIKIILEEDITIVSLYKNELEGENKVINGYVYSKTTLNDYE